MLSYYISEHSSDGRVLALHARGTLTETQCIQNEFAFYLHCVKLFSVYNVYITNQFQITFAPGGGRGGGVLGL